MALETATFISQLNPANPTASDGVVQGDDHMRLIKQAIKNTFPLITGAVTVDQTKLNYLANVTSDIQAQINAASVAPTFTANRALESNGSGAVAASAVTTTELSYLTGVTSAIQTQLNARALGSRQITAGAGLTGGGDLTADRTISHADTSAQASVNNSGDTYIQDVTLDEFGHVIGLASGTVSINYATGNAALGVGGVGTYAFLQYAVNASSNTIDVTVSAGTTVSGSSLLYSSSNNSTSGTPSGTWRCMGFIRNSRSGSSGEGFVYTNTATVWLRIS